MGITLSTGRRVALAISLGLALANVAQAEGPRPCGPKDTNGLSPAPMPKVYASLMDVKTLRPRTAAYMIDIDDNGRPAVRCQIKSATYDEIADEAAAALEAFEYWPADSTAGKGLRYVMLLAGTNGLKIPSVLPGENDPPCDAPQFAGPEGSATKPIYRPEIVYPFDAGVEGEVTMVMRVDDTGAVRLVCRGVGKNVEVFEKAAYYFAAQFRFAAEPGRAPFTYRVTARYGIR